jgi:hypothetical protein
MIGSFDPPDIVALFFEFGMERRQPQLGRLGQVEQYTSDDLIGAEGIARILET